MATSPEVKRPRDRAPSGVVTNRRLRVGLMPAELAELERRAEADGRTLAAMARIYLLRGMHAEARHTALEGDLINPPTPSEEPKS